MIPLLLGLVLLYGLPWLIGGLAAQTVSAELAIAIALAVNLVLLAFIVLTHE